MLGRHALVRGGRGRSRRGRAVARQRQPPAPRVTICEVLKLEEDQGDLQQDHMQEDNQGEEERLEALCATQEFIRNYEHAPGALGPEQLDMVLDRMQQKRGEESRVAQGQRVDEEAGPQAQLPDGGGNPNEGAAMGSPQDEDITQVRGPGGGLCRAGMGARAPADGPE